MITRTWKTAGVAAIALAVLLAAGQAGASSKGLVRIPTAWTRCALDSDCMLVDYLCCGCYEGGVSISINARYLEAYDLRFEKACPEFLPGAPDPHFCPAAVTCPAGAELFCNARGRCEFGVR